MIVNPCRRCTERTAECHAICVRYGAYAAQRKTERDKAQARKRKDNAAVEFLVDNQRREYRRAGKKK